MKRPSTWLVCPGLVALVLFASPFSNASAQSQPESTQHVRRSPTGMPIDDEIVPVLTNAAKDVRIATPEATLRVTPVIPTRHTDAAPANLSPISGEHRQLTNSNPDPAPRNAKIAEIGSPTNRENDFNGENAGASNTGGSYNSFFGAEAGESNSTGMTNSFVGTRTGHSNTTGSSNAFVGYEAGQANTTGSFNVFSGERAGTQNTTGDNNTFLGDNAGAHNRTGKDNTFVGRVSGFSVTTGSDNTFVGAASDATPGISNATAIGARCRVDVSNSVILGRDANVGIKTSAPISELEIGGNGTITLSPRADNPTPSPEVFKLYIFHSDTSSELRVVTPEGKVITVARLE